MHRPLPFRERRLHVFFAVVLGVFAFSSFASDMLGALGVDHENSDWPLAQATAAYGHLCSQLILQNPPWMRVVLGISAFVFGPVCVFLVYGFARARPWTRPLTLVFSSAILYSMLLYVPMELFGPLPTPNAPIFLAINLPWVILPAWMLVYMWRNPDPFGYSRPS